MLPTPVRAGSRLKQRRSIGDRAECAGGSRKAPDGRQSLGRHRCRWHHLMRWSRVLRPRPGRSSAKCMTDNAHFVLIAHTKGKTARIVCVRLRDVPKSMPQVSCPRLSKGDRPPSSAAAIVNLCQGGCSHRTRRVCAHRTAVSNSAHFDLSWHLGHNLPCLFLLISSTWRCMCAMVRGSHSF